MEHDLAVLAAELQAGIDISPTELASRYLELDPSADPEAFLVASGLTKKEARRAVALLTDADEPPNDSPSGDTESTAADEHPADDVAGDATGDGSDPIPNADDAGAAAVDVPDGTIDDVLAWVGDDAERARQAIAAENAEGGKARKTLVEQLAAIAG